MAITLRKSQLVLRPYNMAGPTQKEQQLLSASKDFHNFIESQKTDSLSSLVTPEVTLHKDAITIQADVKGVDDVKQYFQSYFDKYSFKHVAVCGAVDEKANVAFSFAVDQKVTPSAGKFDESFPDWAKAPSDTAGIWLLEFNGQGKITDIWFLRQLSADEQFRKYKKTVDYSKLNLDPLKYQQSNLEASADRAKKIDQNAHAFSDIWSTGDPSAADSIMAADVRDLDVLYVSELKGPKAFQDMITGVFKSWKQTSSSDTIAVTPGNKAFVHWSAEGKLETGGDKQSNKLFGLNMLVFNEECKIAEVIGFRQPMSSERQQLLKAEA
ncbi:hypothetical protein WJX72_005413 [[Myrmecia] bisecta]|uniref:SnoaL-like domain-containing protein n=1 Tax=[Myrmecia] bisecta TaxID=41462 RepID=A0AAW1QQN7_9CHLO